MKVGYASDGFGQTRKYEIIDETISGKYVCRPVPLLLTRNDGTKYTVDSPVSLFLKDKSQFSDVHEEEI